ncbi:MAG: hypothetical protein VB934_10165, partial [Polyangiaceae bacterium]
MFHAPLLLSASVAAFLVGPALHQAGRRVVAWRTALDGFALVAVGGLAALHLLPEALLHGGLVAVVLALLGAILPTLWERGASHAPNWLGLSVVLGGLAMHAAIESAALGAIVSEDHATSLGVAIASHRLPVGLMVFALVQSHKSTRAAYGAIALLAVSTIVGFASGEAANQFLGGRAGMWFQALAAGSLLHVVFAHHDPMCCDEEHAPETLHDHDHEHQHKQPDAPASSPTFWSAIGGLFGLATVISALHAGHAGHAGHAHGAASQHGHLTETLVLLAVECAPALLLAYLLAGLVCAATMPRRPPSLRDGSSFSQTIRGVLYSLPNRITPNAVVPQYEALLGRGVPASAALAFLLAAP